MGPRGQHSERRLATTSRNNYEANWNRRTDGQADRQTDGKDHVLSQADALTKKSQYVASSCKLKLTGFLTSLRIQDN